MRIKNLQLKRAVAVVLLVLLMSAVGMTKTLAQSFTVGNLNYIVNSDGGSVTVTGCTNASGSLTIPALVVYDSHSYAVTTIGNSAFRWCTGFTGDLTIGDNVVTIGEFAFSDCSGFTGNLHLGSSVTTIGNCAFQSCSGFAGELTLTHELDYVGNNAFYSCGGLSGSPSIVLNGTIGSQAFLGCSSLAADVIIGEGVTSVGESAFASCSGMSVIHYNAVNCADVSWSGFIDCGGILEIGENVERIPNRMFYNAAFTGDLVIPNAVTSIGDLAFRYCTAFNGNLTIGDNVVSIGEFAFSDCSGFTGNLHLGSSVTTIGNCAFQSCSGFAGELTMTHEVDYMGTNAFYYCSGLSGSPSIVLTGTIGVSAFYSCSSLAAEVTIGDGVTSIGGGAFVGCSEMSVVHFNATNCADVSESRFIGCGGVLEIGENVERIPTLMFRYANFTGDLTIGDNVVTIGEFAFSDCSGFSGNLHLGSSVTTIGNCAFQNCSGFAGELTMTHELDYVGNNAFYSCGGLSGSPSIVLTGTIGSQAFLGCSSLTAEVIIGEGVTSVGESAFASCSGMSVIHYNAINCSDVSWSGFIDCGGILEIGENVERIPNRMFYNAAFTGGLVIPNAVTSIGDLAFRYCTTFNDNLTIGDNVVTIGEFAFSDCSGFTGSLHLGNSVTTIGNCAFQSCSGFAGELTIGSSVSLIGVNAFYSAAFTAIRSFAEVPPVVENNALFGVNQNIPVIVPCGSLEDYQNADGWSAFTNINDDCPVPHEIAATANPTIGGSITGAGTYYLGDMATLTANANEGFAFVNWTKDGTVVSTNPTYSFMVLEDASFVANFEMIIVTQTASLVSGWNWWSTYAGQNYIDGLSLLEESLGGNGSVIKSQNAFVEYSSTSGWVGALQSINNESSYKILVAEDCTSEINGSQLLPENHPITLNPGWTWIGYPLEQPQTITTALGNYEPTVNDILKGQGGYAIYLPNIGWLPANFTLNPGIGYSYYSMQAGAQTLMYATSREDTPNVEPDNRHWQNDIHAYADNLCLMAVVTIDGTEQRSEDLELGAFVNGECRGSAKLLYIEPLDRYYAMMTITGQNDEVVEFALIDESRHLGNALSTTRLTFSSNAIVGTYDAPFDVAFNAMTAIEEHTSTLYLYPNPVNRNETFNIVIPEDETVVEMTVMNETGAMVFCEKGIDIRHSVSGLSASGLYMIRVVSKSGKVYQSRLVVR